MRNLFIALRVLVPLAILAAVIGQLITSYRFWTSRGVDDVSVNVMNFFSFFTIESNVLSMVFLPLGAWFLYKKRTSDPTWYLVIRVALVTYMATTGIVYNLLLRGIELPQGTTLAWSNEILHVVAPLYLVIDWLFAPGRHPVRYRAIWTVVAFPILWAVYTLIRGPRVFDEIYGTAYWYPYPFLNPYIAPTGYFSVAFYVVLISVVIGMVGLGAVWVSRRRSTPHAGAFVAT